MTLSPSAIAAIIPYSTALWTIFTKCPAPLGPQCRHPVGSEAVAPVPAGRGLGAWPHPHGTDAMFAAAQQRSEAVN